MKKIFLIMVVLLTLASVFWAQGKFTLKIESEQEREELFGLMQDRIKAMFKSESNEFVDKMHEFCLEAEKTMTGSHPSEGELMFTILVCQDGLQLSVKNMCEMRVGAMLGLANVHGFNNIPQTAFTLEKFVNSFLVTKGFESLSPWGNEVLRLWDEYFQSQMVEEMIIYQLAKEKGKSVEEMRKTWEKTKQKVQGGE